MSVLKSIHFGQMRVIGMALLLSLSGSCKDDDVGAIKDVTSTNAIESAIDATVPDEQKMGSLQGFRDEIIGVKDKFALDKLIGDSAKALELIAKNPGHAVSQIDAGKVLVQAHLSLLAPARSIVWRLAKIFKDKDVTHSALLTQVQHSIDNMKTFMPENYWQVAVAYFTEPLDASLPQYDSIEQIQADVAKTAIPALMLAIQTIEDLEIIGDATPVVWDNKLVYGRDSIRDNIDRFVKIGETERQIDLARLWGNVHDLQVFCAYNLNDAFAVSEKMGKLVGVNGFAAPAVGAVTAGVGTLKTMVGASDDRDLLNSPIQGAPMLDRAQTLRSFSSFLTMRDSAMLDDKTGALYALRQLVLHYSNAYDALKIREAALNGQKDDYWGSRTDRSLAFDRPFKLGLEEAKAIVNQAGPLVSAVTGEAVEIDLPGSYMHGPKDLKDLLPIEKVGSINSSRLVPVKLADGSLVVVRNYLFRSAEAWNEEKYRPFIKSVGAGDTGDAVRILSQSWIGSVVHLPLLAFVN